MITSEGFYEIISNIFYVHVSSKNVEFGWVGDRLMDIREENFEMFETIFAE